MVTEPEDKKRARFNGLTFFNEGLKVFEKCEKMILLFIISQMNCFSTIRLFSMNLGNINMLWKVLTLWIYGFEEKGFYRVFSTMN